MCVCACASENGEVRIMEKGANGGYRDVVVSKIKTKVA